MPTLVSTGQLTIVDVNDGVPGILAQPSYVAILSNDSCSVPADNAGTVSSFASAVSTMTVYKGASDDSANWTVAKADVNCTSGLVGKTATVSAMSADAAYVELTATRADPINKLLFTEQFDNAYWTKANLTVIPNAYQAPDGSFTADRIVETAAVSVFHDLSSSVSTSMTAGQYYNYSIYLRAGERSKIGIHFTNNAPFGGVIWPELSVDLITMAITGAQSNVLWPKIEDASNGWLRVSFTALCTVTSASAVAVRPRDASGTSVYTGDITKGFYAWGAQLQNSVSPTTYSAYTPPITKRFSLAKSKGGVAGVQGPAVSVTATRATTFTATDGTLDAAQANITFNAAVSGISSPTYVWTFSGFQTPPTNSGASALTVTQAQFGTAKSATVTCTVNGTYTDVVTIVRLEKSTASPYATPPLNGLVADPNFVQYAAGNTQFWAFDSGITIDATQGEDSTPGARIPFGGAGIGKSLWSTRYVPAKNGDAFYFQARIFVSADYDGQVQALIGAKGATGADLVTWPAITYSGAKGSWQTFSGRLPAISNVLTAQMQPFFKGYGGTAGYILVGRVDYSYSEFGATLGATWGSTLSGQPSDQSIMNTAAAFTANYTWEFQSTLDGWGATNATLISQADAVQMTATAIDPQLIKNGLAINGSINDKVRIRLRRTSGSGAWEGILYYSTAGHSWVGTHYKSVLNPNTLTNWHILEFDMTSLTAGGTDWISNTITGLRFDITQQINDVWEIDWIVVGKHGAATNGATFGVNIGGQITAGNASTFIANAAIGAAQIGSLALVGTGIFNVKSALTGARVEMNGVVMKVYDAAGQLRVQIGDLLA
jgi:hypothetical protein